MQKEGEGATAPGIHIVRVSNQRKKEKFCFSYLKCLSFSQFSVLWPTMQYYALLWHTMPYYAVLCFFYNYCPLELPKYYLLPSLLFLSDNFRVWKFESIVISTKIWNKCLPACPHCLNSLEPFVEFQSLYVAFKNIPLIANWEQWVANLELSTKKEA